MRNVCLIRLRTRRSWPVFKNIGRGVPNCHCAAFFIARSLSLFLSRSFFPWFRLSGNVFCCVLLRVHYIVPAVIQHRRWPWDKLHNRTRYECKKKHQHFGYAPNKNNEKCRENGIFHQKKTLLQIPWKKIVTTHRTSIISNTQRYTLSAALWTNAGAYNSSTTQNGIGNTKSTFKMRN